MRAQLELLLTALGFFTRLPVPAWVAWSPQRLAQALAWLPLIGWLVGGLCALGYLLFALVLPPLPAVVLSLACGVLLTGAFHEDGFADSCDGLGGGWDKAQILAIMKDSRMGSYGVIGLVLLLLTKTAALVELAQASSSTLVCALLVAHPLSRLAAVAIAHHLPYARTDDSSKSAPLARPLTARALVFALGCGLLPVLLLPFAQAGLLLAGTLLITLAGARLFRRRLGGYTGDLLGATQQSVETACYLLLLTPL